MQSPTSIIQTGGNPWPTPAEVRDNPELYEEIRSTRMPLRTFSFERGSLEKKVAAFIGKDRVIRVVYQEFKRRSATARRGLDPIKEFISRMEYFGVNPRKLASLHNTAYQVLKTDVLCTTRYWNAFL